MPKQVKIENELITFVGGGGAAGRLPARVRTASEREAPAGEATMPGVPSNLALKMLHEARAARDRHEERFGRIEKKLDDMPGTLAHAPGVPGRGGVRREGVRKRLDAQQSIGRLEERV